MRPNFPKGVFRVSVTFIKLSSPASGRYLYVVPLSLVRPLSLSYPGIPASGGWLLFFAGGFFSFRWLLTIPSAPSRI